MIARYKSVPPLITTHVLLSLLPASPAPLAPPRPHPAPLPAPLGEITPEPSLPDPSPQEGPPPRSVL